MGRAMAYRRSNGKGRRKRMQPAVMQLSYIVPSGVSYVDLALGASIVNRRGYKQQDSTWAVAQFEVFNASASDTGTFAIEKLPETWVMSNAYTKSKALWHKMNDQVLETEPDISGAYSDFKIGMDSNHVTESIQDSGNESGRILTPGIVDALTGDVIYTNADFNGAVAPVADWDFSKLEIPNDPASGVTTGYTMHAVGPNTAGSKGLIAGYELSRARPNQIDPNVPGAEGWMNELFDDGEQLEDIRDNLAADNDRAPYPVGAETGSSAFYPGGANELTGLQQHSFCNFSSTTVSQKNSVMGGLFPCGLIKFNNATGANLSVIIHMVPGNHRGYMVEVDA